MEPTEPKAPAEGDANQGRTEACPSPARGVPTDGPSRNSDADPIGTGTTITRGDAPVALAMAHEAHPANAAVALEPKAPTEPLDPAPSGSLEPVSDNQPLADTSVQGPVEGSRGEEQGPPSDGAPSGTSGGSRPRHHLLRHTLPPELAGLNCVHHFGVDAVAPALRLVQTMSQRELQQAFEKVYNVKSSSNNNNWLRKKLVEALVPRESSNDPEVDSILEELASRSGTRKRHKEWSSGASGNVDGWRGHHMPPQLNPYAPYPAAALAAAQAQQAAAAAAAAPTNQRKSSKVRPSPTDAEAGYNGEDWGAPAEEVTAAGRKKRRAAAGVAAATAPVLRDPALEEIEKADLRRAAMGEYERRWGTGSPGYGGRGGGGGGGHRGGRGRADRDGEAAAGQQDLAKTLQSLTHLLGIAVQQGKLTPTAAAPGGWGGSQPGGLSALGALAAQAMQAQYYGQAPQQQQRQQFDYAVQQQQQAVAPPSLAGALAALIQQQQQQAAGRQQNSWVGGFGGAPPPPAPAPPVPASAPAAPLAAEQQSVLARLLTTMAQDPSRTPEQLQQLRALAAQASAGSAAPTPGPAPAAAATLQHVLAARIAQLRAAGTDGQAPAGDLPRQGSSEVPAPAPTTGPSGDTSIPGSNYPVDSMLMQLLQQQQAQRAAAAAMADGSTTKQN